MYKSGLDNEVGGSRCVNRYLIRSRWKQMRKSVLAKEAGGSRCAIKNKK
jgi:hypothetical protein